jgi:hypothetical protein
VLRRKANKPMEDYPLSNTDDAILCFIQGRELCSHGIIGVSHLACARRKEYAMAEIGLTASSNRHLDAGRNQGAWTLYGRQEPRWSGPRSPASSAVLKPAWPLAVVNPTSKQSTSPLPPHHHRFLATLYTPAGTPRPLTVNLTTCTQPHTSQWPTSFPPLRTSILVYHCILTIVH